MECNIDAKGKAIRLIGGLFTLLLGMTIGIFYGMGILIYSEWLTISICLIIGGCFAIFEGKAGWCAIRAIGIKTPI